ncbi:hypothetical protein [Streptomyces sp. NPDC054887]
MPRYLISYPKGKQSEDILVENPELKVTMHGEWVVLSDPQGPCLMIPAHADAIITRIDEAEE